MDVYLYLRGNDYTMLNKRFFIPESTRDANGGIMQGEKYFSLLQIVNLFVIGSIKSACTNSKGYVLKSREIRL